MIVRERPSPWGVFFVLRGSLVPRIWPQVAGVALVSALVVGAHRVWPSFAPGFSQAPFALIGVALSIFLSFRNSASYDRWWEARRLWGRIIGTARDLARQTLPLDAEGAVSPERRRILEAAAAFAAALVAQLRGAAPPPTESAQGRLDAIAHEIAAAGRAGRLDPMQALLLQQSLERLSQAAVGCERMANTPLPFAYTLLLHRTAYLFCFLLPFGLADGLGWATPLASALVAYTYFGLDALGEELEEPFGLEPNDLPIAAYATTVAIELGRALGDADLPEPPRPRNYQLT